jgi:thiamine pyrophosphate-dependent acetolactate synthase large subunit-like protein
MLTADAKPTVAETLARTLQAVGVRQLYGVPGDSIVALLDALRGRGLEPTLVRHERWAAEYARADADFNARPSACFAAAGPGMVNLLQGAVTLPAAGAPVILLTSGARAEVDGPELFQEVDEAALFRRFCSIRIESARDLIVAVERIHRLPELGSPLHISMPPGALAARFACPRQARSRPSTPPGAQRPEEGKPGGAAANTSASSIVEVLASVLLASAGRPRQVFIEDPRITGPSVERSEICSVWRSTRAGSALAAAVAVGGTQDVAVICPLEAACEFGAEFATLVRARLAARTIVICPCPADRRDRAISVRAAVCASGGKAVIVRDNAGLEQMLQDANSPGLVLSLVTPPYAGSSQPSIADPDPTPALALLEALGTDRVFSTVPAQSVGGRTAGRLIHEPDPEVASLMASGYAKLTHTRATLLTTRAHVLRTLGGLFDAKADGIAFTVLVLSDEPEGSGESSPVPDGIDAVGDLIVKWNTSTWNDDADRVTALREAAAATRGLVILQDTRQRAGSETFDTDSELCLLEPDHARGDWLGLNLHHGPSKAHPDSATVHLVRRSLVCSNAVTFLLGRGAASALPGIHKLAQELPAVVVTTMLGPLQEVQKWSNYAGRAGESGQISAYYALSTAALVVRIGVSDRGRNFIPLRKRVINVNLTTSGASATSGKQLTLPADARSFVRSLVTDITGRPAGEAVSYLRRSKHVRRCTRIYHEHMDKRLRRCSEDFAASEALLTLSEFMCADGWSAPIAVDVGTTTLWAYRFLESPGPLLWSASYATMGFAVPAAIAVAVGTAEPAIAVTGDGGALCTLQAMRAAVRHRVPITVMVLNNRRLAAVKFEQESRGLPEACNDLSGFDFSQYARLIGLDNCRVTSRKALSSVIKRLPTRRTPLLIEVLTDPKEVPLPWLPNREQIRNYLAVRIGARSRAES